MLLRKRRRITLPTNGSGKLKVNIRALFGLAKFDDGGFLLGSNAGIIDAGPPLRSVWISCDANAD
jgi:hypothetical protein